MNDTTTVEPRAGQRWRHKPTNQTVTLGARFGDSFTTSGLGIPPVTDRGSSSNLDEWEFLAEAPAAIGFTLHTQCQSCGGRGVNRNDKACEPCNGSGMAAVKISPERLATELKAILPELDLGATS